ncbi:DUF1573 domain-containing protein [Ruficoccus amylovorans]|uniref:DUF1573 domain-containing protein n=1 Tax=Ruficoccus amylovorans TaxID=1804625 RepID=A0A842HBY3_9BACT|nr:DUF1573 domain-containing protein [Ruficoccus amylovorans]MBC2593074.1 DUF1573 domain-containing protein [Ruficoccus amylovorans]
MKPINFALAALLGAGTVLPLRAELEWETTTVTAPAEFGQASLQAAYPFKNTGSEPVRIVEVKTSCGCTYAAASQQLIPPGESAEIVAFFETEEREGPQTSSITVLTDEKAHPATVLRFHSDIPPAALLPTRVVKWSTADGREAKVLEIPTQPGVELVLGKPKRPLPVTVQLETYDSKTRPASASAAQPGSDSDPASAGQAPANGYTLTLTPLEGERGSGILPIEAHWADGRSRVYNIYVRCQ